MLQTRLSPKLRLMAELMARSERRTISSLIEGLIEKAAQDRPIDWVPLDEAGYVGMSHGNPKKTTTVSAAVEDMWEPETESSRFVAFALCFPHLLTDYEFRLWRMIKQTPYFWKYFPIKITTQTGEVLEDWEQDMEYFGLLHEHLHEHWKVLNEIITQNKPYTALPTCCQEIGKKCSPIGSAKYAELYRRKSDDD